MTGVSFRAPSIRRDKRSREADDDLILRVKFSDREMDVLQKALDH